MALNNGGRISLSNVNSLGSPLFTGNTSLVSRDKQAMGDPSSTGTSRISASRVCMPSEFLNSTLTTQASTVQTPWLWSGTGSVWGPHKLSEFWGAYSNIPYPILGKQATGNSSTFILLISIGGEYSATTGSYAYRSGTTPFGSWTSIAGGSQVSVGPISTGTWTVAVRDAYNCGSSYDLRASITYP